MRTEDLIASVSVVLLRTSCGGATLFFEGTLQHMSGAGRDSATSRKGITFSAWRPRPRALLLDRDEISL